MAIVGGFIGGGVKMVPAGYMQIVLQWNTEDRLNISGAVFTISGTNGTYTANGDDSGRSEVIVPVGDYTISVAHGGDYTNDGPQRVIGESAQTYLVLFDAYSNPGAGSVTFIFPESLMVYEQVELQFIKGAEVVSVVHLIKNSYTFGASKYGEYTLKITYFGTTHTESFEVQKGISYEINVQDRFKRVTISEPVHLASIPVYFNGYPKEDICSGSTFWILKEPYTVTIKDDYYYQDGTTRVFTSAPITTTTVDETISHKVVSSSFYHITSDGNFVAPFTGVFNVKCFGGGHQGSHTPSTTTPKSTQGGGGGFLAEDDLSLKANESYPITIGAGGFDIYDGDWANPEPTSFGTLLSASGATGQAGGTGGGGGAYSASSGGSAQYGGGGGGCGYANGGAGGTYGGGGGGGASSNKGSGGAGGMYGGNGGGGCDDVTSTDVITAAEDGVDTTSMTHLEFTGTGKAGEMPPKFGTSSYLHIGGGGGGGYGGKGGNGAYSYYSSSGSLAGGGGGGGIGADGGNASGSTEQNTSKASRYNAGGGGGGYGGKGGNGYTFHGGGGGGYGSTKLTSDYGVAGTGGYGYGAGGPGSSSETRNGAPGIVVVTFGKRTSGWY